LQTTLIQEILAQTFSAEKPKKQASGNDNSKTDGDKLHQFLLMELTRYKDMVNV
jgi:hypothetical protein